MRHLAGSDDSRGQGRPSLAAKAVFLIGALASMALPSVVLAQGKYSWESYEERVKSANSITAYGTDMFGEQVSLQNGALSFRVTDVSLPGNNGLSVALSRSYTVKNRQGLPSNDLLADWQVDLPRLTGTYADAWLVASTSGARCSDIRGPAVPPTPSDWRSRFSLSDFWQGVQLELPGGGGGELLLPVAQARKPSDGNTYVWNANNGQTQLRCIPTIANGTGEGFVAVTPDGTKYTFNWMARKPVPNLRETVPSLTGGKAYTVVMPLWETSLYATRVEDRHGNWVQYSYSNAWNQNVKLTGVSSSDGRSLAVTYTTANPLRIHQVSDGTRTWNYGYGLDNAGRASLASVGLPDGTSWGINFSSLTHSPINYVGAEDTRSCTTLNDPVNLDLEPVGIITSPSGAVGTFRVGMVQHGFSNVTITCHNVTITPVNNPSDDEPLFVQSYLSWSLLEKQITGPGLPAMNWSYSYASDISGHYYGTSSPAVPWCRLGATCFQPICTSDSCAGTARSLVTGPDGNKTRYVFGNSWQYNVGKLLRVESLDSSDAIVKTVTNTYDLSRTDKTYPARYGTSLRVNFDGFESQYHRPQLGASTLLDGVTFSWSANTCGAVPCLDYWARPTQVTRASALGSKMEATAFWDQESKWVLGQMLSVNVSGTKVTSADYDPATANMLRVYGQNDLLLQTLTYNTDGTVATVKDGRNLVTTLSNWYRGVPRSVLFHDGTSQSATVNPMGWVTSTTDQNTFTTGYDYDAAGRISQVTPPAGDTVAWLPTNSSFTRSSVAAYGLPAGHWRNVVTHGNFRKETYYDGLWRPRMTREYDTANEAATRRVSVTAYQPGGQVAFTSYPAADAASVSALLQGVWSEYDALGRVRSVSQDSEWGLLTTLTEYLPDFKTRVSSPRGPSTTTSYQAFDQPDTSAPISILAPEGATTSIVRDTLGRTLSLTRSGSLAGQIESVTRQYVYDNHGRLCKTIEPETLATVVDYDAAGNIAWSKSGAALLSTDNCNRAEVPTSQRTLRAYDALNRLTGLVFPDNLGNTSFLYTPDGLVREMVADNGGAGLVTSTYAYNKRRLLAGESTAVDGHSWGVGYGYNPLGHLAAHVTPLGNIEYAPNALGQPTKAGTYATAANYHPNGGLKQFTFGNGLVHTLTQNERGLTDRSRDALGATAVYDESLDYDKNGNVTAITDGLAPGRGDRDMTYDALDRLTGTTSPMFGSAVYRYDVLDNLKSVQLTAGTRVRNHTYLYDANNRLATVKNTVGGTDAITLQYDAQGNVRNKNGQLYTFDHGNRLREAVGLEQYRYDGHGRRVRATHPTLGNIYSVYGQDGVLRYQRDERAGKAYGHVYLAGRQVARLEDAIGLPAPVVTSPASSANGAFTVSWTSVAMATRYELQQRTDGGAWATIHDAAATSKAVSGLATGTHGYQARACSAIGCGAYSAVSNTVVSLVPSTAPTLTVPATNATGSHAVSWTTVASATRYELQQRKDGGAWSTIHNAAATSTTVSGLTNGTYGYQARACNAAGCGPFSASYTTAVTLPPIAAPTVTAPATNFTGAFTVSWSSVAGATRYELQQRWNSGAWVTVHDALATSRAVSGLAAGSYTFQARACVASSCGGYSPVATTVVTLPPTTAPTLTVPATNATGSFTVSWSPVATATRYELQQRKDGGAWSTVHDAAATSKAISGLMAGTYGYQARACNVAGCGPDSAIYTTGVTLPPATAPSVTTPASNTSGAFTVSWPGVATATRYELQQRKDGGAWSTIHDGAATSKAVSGLASGTYGFQARACNVAGCSPLSGIASTVVTLTVPPPPVPASLVVFGQAQDWYFAGWPASAGATSYELRVDGGATFYTGPATNTEFSSFALVTYSVRACNAGGCSAWSAPVSPVPYDPGPLTPEPDGPISYQDPAVQKADRRREGNA